MDGISGSGEMLTIPGKIDTKNDATGRGCLIGELIMPSVVRLVLHTPRDSSSVGEPAIRNARTRVERDG